jgi:hypothetical protein
MSNLDAAYTLAQVQAALTRAGNLAWQLTGDDGYADVIEPFRRQVVLRKAAAPYTIQEISAVLNAAADRLSDADYENSDTIYKQDACNLMVNVTGWLLEHPDAGMNALEEAIADSYADIEPDFSELPDGAEEPAKGSPEWDAAVMETVAGWLS